MMEKTIIPLPFLLEMDDVGWDDGRDLRLSGLASRSGLPRNHAKEDYELLRSLSDSTGKNIAVAFCLGDWDKENYLRGEVGVTHDPNGWDRGGVMDVAKFTEYRDILDGAEHVEFILHGLLHGVYDGEGKRLHEKEFFTAKKDENGKTVYYVDDWDFERRLDLFLKIYESWGFKKPIRGFVVPCGVYDKDIEGVKRAARMLYNHGIRYWADDFQILDEPIKMIEGVACFSWNGGAGRMPWEAYDCDPSELGYHSDNDTKTCFFGTHFTNFLRFNPKNNHLQLAPWQRFYEKQGEKFGQMCACTVSEAVSQLVYYANASLAEDDAGFTLDVSGALSFGYEDLETGVTVAVTSDVAALDSTYAEITLYEKHDGFNLYKITPTSPIVRVNYK